MPILSSSTSYDDWFFFVDDDVPPTWALQLSTDAGVTWADVDTAPYGVDLADPFSSGDWVRAQRVDGLGTDYGPVSDVTVIP